MQIKKKFEVKKFDWLYALSKKFSLISSPGFSSYFLLICSFIRFKNIFLKIAAFAILTLCALIKLLNNSWFRQILAWFERWIFSDFWIFAFSMTTDFFNNAEKWIKLWTETYVTWPSRVVIKTAYIDQNLKWRFFKFQWRLAIFFSFQFYFFP